MILLDTHAAIWYANNDERLGKDSLALADRALAEDDLAVSAISFWEIALLVARNRLELHNQPIVLRAELLESGVTELPLTGDIALLAVELDRLHADPADRFIAATAIVHNATLVTADNNLLKWRHKIRRQNALK